jgi:hypothetical protein
VVELPKFLARILAAHKIKSAHSRSDAFVFCTRSGRPLGQRNVSRELRRAQKTATDAEGRPAFPVLHMKDANDKPIPFRAAQSLTSIASATRPQAGPLRKARARKRSPGSSATRTRRSPGRSTSKRSSRPSEVPSAAIRRSSDTAESWLLNSCGRLNQERPGRER